MSNTYKLTNAKGEVRRVRSLTQFHVSGEVYYDLDGFHFRDDFDERAPRSSWDHEGYVRNAAERFVLESYKAPVLVVDETQGDLFIGIYGAEYAHDWDGTVTVLAEWRELERKHRALEQARRMQREKS